MTTKLKWDESADLQLLLTIISVHEIKIDYAAVTAALGFGCSTRAIEERLKKIKKRARTTSNSTTSDSKAAPDMASTTTKSLTSKKRKAPVSTLLPQKKSRKNEQAKKEVEKYEVDDDEEEGGGVKLDMGGEATSQLLNNGAQGRGMLEEGPDDMLAAETGEEDEH